jgi:hypothetical protein
VCFGTRLSKLTCRLHLLNLGDEDVSSLPIQDGPRPTSRRPKKKNPRYSGGEWA